MGVAGDYSGHAAADHLPYLILIVELETQEGVLTEHDVLRVAGNLATPDGNLAPHELVAKVGIGTRVRIVFKDSPLASPCHSGPSTRLRVSRSPPGGIPRRRNHSSEARHRRINASDDAKRCRGIAVLGFLRPVRVTHLA